MFFLRLKKMNAEQEATIFRIGEDIGFFLNCNVPIDRELYDLMLVNSKLFYFLDVFLREFEWGFNSSL